MAAPDTSENMMKQAQHIWSMLDDMAVNSPEAYKQFIDKHLKEGKEAFKAPDPHMCIQTSLQDALSGSSETIFINILDWPRIPPPKTDEDPIPTMGGTIFRLPNEGSTGCMVVPVAFNPEILALYGLESSLMEEQRLLINLAIDYVEDQNNVKLSRTFCILPKTERCKGPVEMSRSNLMRKLTGQEKLFEDELSDLEKALGPTAAGCKDMLLKKISINKNDDEAYSLLGSNGASPNIRLPGEKPPPQQGQQSKLIEEISSTQTSLQQPEYDMWISEQEGDRQKLLIIKIKLPNVTSVRECSLEISDDDLYLVVPNRYELFLTFPQRTMGNQSAKFSKRTSCLTVSLEVDL